MDDTHLRALIDRFDLQALEHGGVWVREVTAMRDLYQMNPRERLRTLEKAKHWYVQWARTYATDAKTCEPHSLGRPILVRWHEQYKQMALILREFTRNAW